ncbi:MAG TPA: terminase small subunit [Geminicoccus sp.]|uniref:terminase small subunit n=1 Tax=Geminicoccus sp. TaxID=2024832 RepID=UPI002B7AD90A|nr:terminase small subunit [Geminicoccus sp.]HWL70417.1 terminase small subunit [Geminicoccus sp.]
MAKGSILNRSELARFCGVAPTTVDAWLAAGCPHSRNGKNLVLNSAEVVSWLRKRAAEEGTGEDNLDLAKERARLAREQADKAAIGNARLRGELLPADDVVTGWEGAIIRCRELLMTIPAALTDEIMGLAMAGDGPGIRALLDDRICSALHELANTEIESDDEDTDSAPGDEG